MLYRVCFNTRPDPSARDVEVTPLEGARRDVHWRSVRSTHTKLYRVFNNSTREPADRTGKLVGGLRGAPGVPSASGGGVFPQLFQRCVPYAARQYHRRAA
jgi:hypothetical protein